jgi:hypothetical protein
MTKSRATFGLLAIAIAGGAAASGIVGTEALAKWFPPFKWLTGDTVVAQSQQGWPTQRAVAVEVSRAVKKKTPLILGALGNVTTIASVARHHSQCGRTAVARFAGVSERETGA